MLRIILPLTLSLFILMFAYNAIEAILPLETYGTDFYGYATLSLALIYLSMTVFNLFAGYLVSIKPAGTLILLGPLGYGAFSLAVAGRNEHLWLATAVFLGVTASIYWICIRALILRALHSLSDIAGAAFLLSLMAAGLGTSLNIYLLGYVISAYGILSALVYTAIYILAGACAAGYIIGRIPGVERSAWMLR